MGPLRAQLRKFDWAKEPVHFGELLLGVRDGLAYLPERSYDANARSLHVCREERGVSD